VVSFLLDNGADLTVKDKQGRSVYYYTKDFEVKSMLTVYSSK